MPPPRRNNLLVVFVVIVAIAYLLHRVFQVYRR
jgi:hypothetical protein